MSARTPHQALVVFVGHAECRWLGCLRAGFRHCFVTLHDRNVWLACDPLKDRIELSVLPARGDFDLADFYVRQGHTVTSGLTRPDVTRRPSGIAPLTCVTVVKRVLGVRAPWVLTPWQLYQHLRADAQGFLDVGSALDQA